MVTNEYRLIIFIFIVGIPFGLLWFIKHNAHTQTHTHTRIT